MLTMAELEALSNKELRQKCLEFGMPNVPVTDSSRKIFIKRLEAVMTGKPMATTPAKPSRRETMHVAKPSEVASSPKISVSNNATKQTTANSRPSRRTIAVPERHIVTTTTVSEPEYSDVSPERIEVAPVRAKTKTPEKPTTLYPKLPSKEPSPKPQLLSKTGVVTTSYVQETKPINKTYASPDQIDMPANIDIEEEPVKKNIPNLTKSSYVPLSEPKITTTAPLSANLGSSMRYSSLDDYNYNKPSYLSSANTRKSYMATTSFKPSIASQYASAYEPEMEDDDYEDEEDEVVLIEDSPIKDVETPFLSQFARNLENLKTTPLRHSLAPTTITPQQSILRNREAYSRRTIASPLARRHIIAANNGEVSSFHQFILAMEEKYHLKHSLVLICIFMLAVFIYVFFIQSV